MSGIFGDAHQTICDWAALLFSMPCCSDRGAVVSIGFYIYIYTSIYNAHASVDRYLNTAPLAPLAPLGRVGQVGQVARSHP
jgi:hypothetical protein